MRKYHRITFEERKIIEKMYNSNTPVKKISEKIGCSNKHMYVEIHKGSDEQGVYSAERAQRTL